MGEVTGDQGALVSLLSSVKAVLFDFDGPICSLFAGLSEKRCGHSPTKDVAEAIKAAAREHWARLDQTVEDCEDSHDILQRLRVMYETSPDRLSPVPLKAAEDIVTAAEHEAVRTAAPAADIVSLVQLLSDLGMRLAIVSNNAERPIRAFLDRPDLQLGWAFEGVFGRDPDDSRRMKPKPDCVIRAIEKLSVDPFECLVVGDKTSDLEAAQSARTQFLGYTRKATREAQMMERGATLVVASHQPVVKAANILTALRRESRQNRP